MDADLDEVAVRVRKIEDPLPEIVSEGTRIPWWVWALAGAVLTVLLVERKS